MMFSSGLAEVVFLVKDVQAAARFYREVVGLVPQGEADDEWAWFWVGEPERNQRLALHKGTLLFEEYSPFPEGQRFGTIHYALHVPAERLQQAVEHVKSKDIAVLGPLILPGAMPVPITFTTWMATCWSSGRPRQRLWKSGSNLSRNASKRERRGMLFCDTPPLRADKAPGRMPGLSQNFWLFISK